MSSTKRPWYKWWARDFLADEKINCLSPLAELIYRRALDVMWQANACRLLNDCLRLANALSRGISFPDFEKAWAEIQTPGFELFKTAENGKWIYSPRLTKEMEAAENTHKVRSKSGKKGGKASAEAKAKQKSSKCLSKGQAKIKQTVSASVKEEVDSTYERDTTETGDDCPF